MNVKKRGLSDVVTTVLIILLVLVAIGIIWAAVRPTLEDSGSRISGDCLTIQLESVSCTQDLSGDYTATVRRDVGSGNLQAIKLIFGNSTGSTQVVEQATTISELESATFSAITLTDVTGAVTLKSAAVVGLSGGSTQTCNEEDVVINCLAS